MINIGVNMGVLPTKGLTLPLMSYGRSSMIVTLAWVGLLLRVYHEAMNSTRGMAQSVERRRTEESGVRFGRAWRTPA
jgi:cell division protein FtsW